MRNCKICLRPETHNHRDRSRILGVWFFKLNSNTKRTVRREWNSGNNCCAGPVIRNYVVKFAAKRYTSCCVVLILIIPAEKYSDSVATDYCKFVPPRRDEEVRQIERPISGTEKIACLVVAIISYWGWNTKFTVEWCVEDSYIFISSQVRGCCGILLASDEKRVIQITSFGCTKWVRDAEGPQFLWQSGSGWGSDAMIPAKRSMSNTSRRCCFVCNAMGR